MKRIITAVILLLACSTAARAQQAGRCDGRTADDEHYVIILSMDAFRWDLPQRCHTPTLDSLRRVGVFAETYPVFPANTFPNHYSMATGLHPDRHNIVNNGFYDRSVGREMSVFKHSDTATPGFWGGDPRWNTAERQGRTAQIYMWPGSDIEIGGRQASIWTRYTDEPSYFERADWVVASMCGEAADGRIPNLVMWYFEEPDAVMHEYGPDSDEIIPTIEHIDSALAYFFREIRRSPVFDRINFIVTADHGMAQLSKERYINLNGTLDERHIARVVSGRPLGIEVDEEYLDTAVEIIDRIGHIKAYKRDSMPEKWHYGTNRNRITNLLVVPDNGWTVEYADCDKPRDGGTHGFDPFERDMHTVFYASGPMFRKGYEQRSFQNLNIYLVLCHLLGIEPSPNDGCWEDVCDMFAEGETQPDAE